MPAGGGRLPARSGHGRHPTLPLHGVPTHVSVTLPPQNLRARRTGPHHCAGLKRQRHPRHGARAGHQHPGGDSGVEKKSTP